MNYPLKDFAAFIVGDGDMVGDGEAKTGVLIRCPNCRMPFGAWFRNPIGNVEPSGRVQWDRTGETLETLSLFPSFMFVGHCHSWIKDGQIQVDSAFSCPPIDPEHVV